MSGRYWRRGRCVWHCSYATCLRCTWHRRWHQDFSRSPVCVCVVSRSGAHIRHRSAASVCALSDAWPAVSVVSLFLVLSNIAGAVVLSQKICFAIAIQVTRKCICFFNRKCISHSHFSPRWDYTSFWPWWPSSVLRWPKKRPTPRRRSAPSSVSIWAQPTRGKCISTFSIKSMSPIN